LDFVIYKIAKPGERGEKVERIQSFLKKQGFYTYPTITGYYGPVTEAAVKAFQTKYPTIYSGLGLVVPTTWFYNNSLNKAMKSLFCGTKTRERKKTKKKKKLMISVTLSSPPLLKNSILLNCLIFKTKSKTFSVYYPKTRPSHNRYTIVASMNSHYSDWEVFSDEEYALEKKALIERTLIDLNRYFPNAKEKIDWVEAATPRTFNRYTLHTRGTSFGTKFEGLAVSRNIFKEVSGLFHVGSVGIIMSGWLGAINYGVIVSNDVDAYMRSKG